MLLAKLKEECQENFNGELEAKLMKIIGCCVPRVPVPEWLVKFLYRVSRKTVVQKGVHVFCNYW